MTKKEARERMKRLRRELSNEERKERNARIFTNFMQMEQVRQAEWLFPFVSYGTEADTMRIIQYNLQAGKKVAIPRVEKAKATSLFPLGHSGGDVAETLRDVGGKMDFYQITSMEDLHAGYHGILEPTTEICVPASEGVMLLPGLAFDRKGNRVGYGGGYYDHYLRRFSSKHLITIAVAFDFQIVDVIEADAFDRKPQWIVTDQAVYSFC